MGAALLSLDTFVGNSRAVQILRRAIEQDRLPHAMIFSGPAGVGKCTLALLVARYLNCLSRSGNDACGECSACRRILAVIESRGLECRSSKEGYCGNCPACRTRMKRHPDIRLIEPEKTTIGIDQVRDLVREIAFQPLEARYRVVILDPAEQMRPEAHNSLLKTLEEPPSRTVIILVTANPYLLLETIRSRCRMLHFGEIPRQGIERHLAEHEKRTAEEARLAAALCGGSLGAALDFDAKAYLEVRAEAFRFVRLILGRGEFAEASALAAPAAKDKQGFEQWIGSVSALLEDLYYAALAPERVGQRDLGVELRELGRTVSRASLVGAIEAVGHLRSAALKYNLNRQIALEAMFLELGRAKRR